MLFIFILGAIIFLIVEHTLAFFLVFVPLEIVFLIVFLGALLSHRCAMPKIFTLPIFFGVIILALLIVCM